MSNNLKLLLRFIIGFSVLEVFMSIILVIVSQAVPDGPPFIPMIFIAIIFIFFLVISISAWRVKTTNAGVSQARKKFIKFILIALIVLFLGVPILAITALLLLSVIEVSKWKPPSSSGVAIVGGLPIPLSGNSINFISLLGMYAVLAAIVYGLFLIVIGALKTIINDF